MSTEPVQGTPGIFERAYHRGVLTELEPPPRPASGAGGAPGLRAAPSEPVALRGAVITPHAAWSDGYVVVDQGTIAAAHQDVPSAVRMLEAGGVLLPVL